MNPVLKYIRLPSDKRRLLLRAFLWLSAAVVAVRLLPLVALRRVFVQGRVRGSHRLPLEIVLWAFEAVGHRMPVARCLPRALAGAALLRTQGFRCEVRIGATRAQGKFAAHAWVMCEGKIVIGDADTPSQYALLLRMNDDMGA